MFNPGDFETNILNQDQLNQLNALFLNKTNNDTMNGSLTLIGGLNLNSGINADNKIISNVELGYLDSVTSNIQSQMDLKNPLINNNTNLTLNQLTSNSIINNGINLDTKLTDLTNTKLSKTITSTENNLVVFSSNNNIKDNLLSIMSDTSMVNPSSNLIPSSLVVKTYIDDKINNLQNNVAIGGGVNFYFTNTNHPTIPNYEYINNFPDNTGQDIKSVNVRNNELLLSTYITNNLNKSILNRGIFQFYFYASVNDIDNYSYIKVEIFKRSSLGTETLIINNIKSNDINVIYPNNNVYICEATIQNDIGLLTTDELVFKIYGGTLVTNKDVTVYFYHGGSTNSYIVTPFVTSHNQLVGLNEGDFKHLTQTEYTNCTSIVTASNSGILNPTLYNTFNDKAEVVDVFGYKFYISKYNGSDNYNGYSENQPFQTINKAFTTVYINFGIHLILNGGNYDETVNISAVTGNLTISNICNDFSSIVTIQTVNVNSNTSSIRFSNIRIQNLNIIGTSGVYLQNCYIDNLTKTGNGYLELTNCSIVSTYTMSSSNSIIVFKDSCKINYFINTGVGINNIIQLNNVINCLNVTVTAGNTFFSMNSVIYGTSNVLTNYAIVGKNTSVIILQNTTIINAQNNLIHTVSFESGCVYSFNDCIFNKTSSNLVGTKNSRINHSNYIQCDDIVVSNSANLFGIIDRSELECLQNCSVNIFDRISKVDRLYQPYILEISTDASLTIQMNYQNYIFRSGNNYNLRGQTNYYQSYDSTSKTPRAYTSGFYQCNLTFRLVENSYMNVVVYTGLHPNLSKYKNLDLFDFYYPVDNLRRSFQFSQLVYLAEGHTINFRNDVPDAVAPYLIDTMVFTMVLVSPQLIV